MPKVIAVVIVAFVILLWAHTARLTHYCTALAKRHVEKVRAILYRSDL